MRIVKWIAGVLLALLVVGGVAGYVWWNKPLWDVRDQLESVEVPDTLRRTDERVDNNPHICFDSCSVGVTHYYTTTLRPRQTIEALATALRESGYAVEVKECRGSGCVFANSKPYEIRGYPWHLTGSKGAVTVRAYAGSRVDGQSGASLSVHRE